MEVIIVHVKQSYALLPKEIPANKLFLLKRYLIYVPSDMIQDLSNHTLIPLIVSRPNSLLIIEDAEGSLSRS
jgi:hypothetical protein